MQAELSEDPFFDETANVVFRDACDADFGGLAAIRRDRDIQAMLLTVPESTDDQAVRDWIERRRAEKGGIFRVIADASTDTVLGFIQIGQVHRRNRTGYGGLALISEARGRGLGRIALNLLMRTAFETLGLSKLLLEVHPDNQPALKLYASSGFAVVGTLKAHFRDVDGRAHDVVLLERML
ncbi:GNAT family N-acetyltransferase [Pararhizobium sp.]|uniref:GNAT family N-acetyltransferase n=1 Tax=Pararhizobium sp. TaxID=1977563 RepID=UPI00271A8005|nr:GNAT family protein [Pararhizobium sp.]MDO9416272.1 GNAT family protein [Pararhizobium sp.]